MPRLLAPASAQAVRTPDTRRNSLASHHQHHCHHLAHARAQPVELDDHLFREDTVAMSSAASPEPITTGVRAAVTPVASRQVRAADVHVFLPQIHHVRVPPPSSASSRSPPAPGRSPPPRQSGCGTWSATANKEPFCECLADTSMWCVSPAGTAEAQVCVDASRSRCVDLLCRPADNATAGEAINPPATPRLEVSGGWESLCLPGVLTPETHTFLAGQLVPHKQEAECAQSQPREDRGAAESHRAAGDVGSPAALVTGSRGGSLKRARDCEVEDAGDSSGLCDDVEKGVITMLGERRVVGFQRLSTVPGWLSVPSLAWARGCVAYRLHFTLQSHLLGCRLPGVVAHALRDALTHAMLSGRGEQLRGAAPVAPLWIACFAHTHAVHAAVLTCVESTLSHRPGEHTRSVQWPAWVPNLECSVSLLNALQAAAWTVVRDIVTALQAEARVRALGTSAPDAGVHHGGGTSFAMLSLSHLLEAVLSPARQGSVLSVFQAHLPFFTHRSDMLRSVPCTAPPPPPVAADEESTISRPTARTASFSASTSPMSSIKLARYPSALELIYYLAWTLLARYLPPWASRLLDVLSVGLCDAVPTCAAPSVEADRSVCGVTSAIVGATPPHRYASFMVRAVQLLRPWRLFWQAGAGLSAATPLVPAEASRASYSPPDASLRLSVAISQWSIRSMAWLLSPASLDEATGVSSPPVRDGVVLALFLAVLPRLCGDYLNTQEIQSVMERALHDLAVGDDLDERGFRLLMATLIVGAHTWTSLSGPLCWSTWLAPLRRVLEDVHRRRTACSVSGVRVEEGQREPCFAQLLARLTRALRWVRREQHALATAAATTRAGGGGGDEGVDASCAAQCRRRQSAHASASPATPANEERGEPLSWRTEDVTSSAFFAAAASSAGGGGGGASEAISGFSGWTEASSIDDHAEPASAAQHVCGADCLWLRHVHQRHIRALRALLVDISQRGCREVDLRVSANDEEANESPELRLDEQEEEEEEEEYFFAMLARAAPNGPATRRPVTPVCSSVSSQTHSSFTDSGSDTSLEAARVL